MPYIEREKGVRIHYNHYGKGFPLVFLHGFSANAWLWAYQAPILAHKYHCVVIEARGHGLSSKPLTGYSIQDMAADDAAVLAASGHRPRHSGRQLDGRDAGHADVFHAGWPWPVWKTPSSGISQTAYRRLIIRTWSPGMLSSAARPTCTRPWILPS